MDPCEVPSVSYADLLQPDTDTGDLAKETLVKSLNDYGACRIHDHGIPQDLIDNCFDKVSRWSPPFFFRYQVLII